jgi:asparagine synthase (glutamine-hydrolysing)
LMKADKISMANSIELRTPFLDYRVVEYAARMPDRLKVGPDTDGTYRTKLALRRVADGRLPPAIIERPKKGFPVPAYDWLSGGLRGWASEILLDPAARLRDWCRSSALETSVTNGTSPMAQMMDRHRLWNLVILELWLQCWLQKDTFLPLHR